MSLKNVRKAAPNAVLKLWEAMNYIRQNKQFSGDPRIKSYLCRGYQWSEEDVEATIRHALEDGLIVEYNVVGYKGIKAGVGQRGYKIPEDEFVRGENDWYCTVCHAASCDVKCCRCWRVAHLLCLPNDAVQSGRYVCDFCGAAHRAKKWDRNQLAKYLTLIMARLRDKGKELNPLDDLNVFGTDCSRLLFERMDLAIIEDKVFKLKYSCLPDFAGDVHTIMHNICLCVGDEHKLALAAWSCLEDAQSEIKEIERCQNCYWLVNMKPDKWYIQVCDPPHDVVFAKMKGYPYWPALVLSHDDDTYDVRFFGGRHQRGVVPSASIKSIKADVKELGIKVNMAFTKAMNELQMYSDLVKKRQCGGGKPVVCNNSNSCDENSSSSSDLVSSTQDGAGASSSMHRSLLATGPLAFSDSSTSSQGPEQKKAKLTKSRPRVSASPMTSGASASMAAASRDSLGASPHDGSEHQLNLEKALKQMEDKLQKKFEKETGETVARITQEAEHRRLEDLKQQKDELTAEHSRQLQDLLARHKEEMSSVKKKQWCYNCEAGAIYHCCWNTAYCSVECQQAHWHKEHKRVCRRKR